MDRPGLPAPAWLILLRHQSELRSIPLRRHKEIASIAQRCNVRIIEDDPYWLLADAPPPPIATF